MGQGGCRGRSEARLSNLEQNLRKALKGDVLFDRASRGRYSTDASIYQVEPLGVIVPETIDDVVAAMAMYDAFLNGVQSVLMAPTDL